MELQDEYDVVVVGGGPAGLSAALRVRRPRTFNFMPQSALLITDSEPGGISNWREVYITGPSWSYRGNELRDRILKDLDRYDVPILRGQVTNIEISGDIKRVFTEGREFRAHALVIATGLKRVRNEREFMGRGLYVTIKGYRFMESIFEEICQKNAGRGVVVVGSPALEDTMAMLERINRGRAEITAVVEGKSTLAGNYSVIEGELLSVEGGEMVEGVLVRTDSGDTEIQANAVIIDFESYMKKNNTLPRMEILNESGFIDVDASMHTSIPGVFAAGDITGPPFSAGKAAGQGITAGLEAFCYVHELKFGERCPGYAFYPMFQDGKPARFEVKSPSDGFLPRLIGTFEAADGSLIFREAKIEDTAENRLFLELSDGTRTIEKILRVAKEKGYGSRERYLTLYRTLVLAKDMTVHVPAGGAHVQY